MSGELSYCAARGDTIRDPAKVHVLIGACTCKADRWYGCRCREIIAYDCTPYYVVYDNDDGSQVYGGGTPHPAELAILMRKYDAPGTDFAYVDGNSDYPKDLAKARAALAAQPEPNPATLEF